MNDFVAGLMAGTTSALVVHPIDTIKVTMQYHSTHSITKAMKMVVKLNSAIGFYRGIAPQLVLQCASQASYYSSYGIALRCLGSDRDKPHDIPLWHNFVAGSFGGFVQAFPSSILELFKIRLQTTSYKQEANVYHLFRHIYQTDGIRGYFRGLHATIWRDSPTYGLYMVVYDPLRIYLHASTNSELLGSLISGGFVGVMSWTLACPVDICKSKQQAGHTNKSLARCLVEVYRLENGIHGYFCGWTAIAVRAFIVNAVSLHVWDRTRRWF